MARTESINVPDELRDQFLKSVEQRDRYILGVCQGHKRLPSDRERKALRRVANIQSPQQGRGSMFKFFSPMWRALSPEQKQMWKDAAAYSFINGWQLFVSDNAARARASLEFGIPPSELWQVRAGVISVDAPATGILLSQSHPLDYSVTRKVRGAPWKEEVVSVRESFGLPLELQIRYKSDLSLIPGALSPTSSGTISGTVSLSSSPVSGATVRCIRQSDNEALTPQTTDEAGEYEFSGLSSSELYHLSVEYQAGDQKYNALSFWNWSSYTLDFALVSYTVPAGDSANFALETYDFQLARARFFAEVWTSYQGQDILNTVECVLSPNTDWTLASASLTSARGIIVGYTLFLQLDGYRGTLLFDNIRATHSGQNWARDPRCDIINRTFTKGLAAVAPFWTPLFLPAGSSYASYYPPSL